MKIYKHIGKGQYVGGIIIAIAECESDAIELMRKELNKNGLLNENLRITECEIKPGVVYFGNGDY